MKNAFAICGLLLLAVGLVFGQTVHYDFVNLDDAAFVYLNSHITGGLTAEAVKWACTNHYLGAYTPMTWMTHMLDCQCYGLNAGGHHLTNVLLHAATAVLLFLVLRQMTGHVWPSAFVAAVFAIHPLRVESVAWVTERKDVLSGLFFVLALGAYVRYVRHRFSFIRYLSVMVLFVLGLLAKPMLVTLPFVLLLLDYWPLGRLTAGTMKCWSTDRGGNTTITSELTTQPWLQQEPLLPLRTSLGTIVHCVLEKIPLLALTVVFCVAAIWSYGSDGVDLLGQRLPLSWRIANVPISYLNYLGMFFYPVGLAIPYPYPSLNLSFWKVFGAVMVLIALTSATLAWRQRCPYLLVGWLWYLGMLVPVSGLLQFGAHTMIADRFTYLPQIGICVALTWGLADAVRSLPHRRLVCSVGAALILVVLMGCAWRQTSFWRDSETLWSRTLACTPPSRLTYHALGDAFLGLGQIDKAIEQYQTAIATEPDYGTDYATSHSQLHYNFGVALASAGRSDEALEQYKRAVQLQPNDVAAQNNLGNALLIHGQIEMGILHCKEALRIDPEFAEAHFNIGNVLDYRGRVDEAIAEYRKALKAKPGFAEAHCYLGIALAKRGQLDDAIAEYRKALKIAPQYEDAHHNLSTALSLQNRINIATEGIRTIVGEKSVNGQKNEEPGDRQKTNHPFLRPLPEGNKPPPGPM